MKRLILALVVMLAVSQTVDAQEVNALRKGVRVEITPMSGKSESGRIMSIRNDSLFYAPNGVSVRSISESGATSLAFADVKSVRVSHGRNVLLSVIVKGLLGTAIGAGSGAILGAATWHHNTDFFTYSRGAATAFYGILGGAGGLIVGTIYGAGNGYEHWETVSLPGR
jgi:hypothetical protein